jgi:transcriptional regulator with XRE-family HTH domain
VSRIAEFLDANGFSQSEVSRAIGVEPSSFSRKLGGSRPWRLSEIKALLVYVSGRLRRAVAYEEVVGAPAEDARSPRIIAAGGGRA